MAVNVSLNGAAGPVRCWLERLEGPLLSGWVLDPVAPGRERLSLRVAGTELACELERSWRQDVAQTLGVPEQRLGFTLKLPVRPDLDQAELLVNGAAVGDAPLGVLLGNLREAAAPAPIALRACLERIDGLHLWGWALDAPEAPASFFLVCQGHRMAAPVRRVERDDVCEVFETRHRAPGFVLELPGALWQWVPAGQAAHLQVFVGGILAVGECWLRREDLSAPPDARPLQHADDTRPDAWLLQLEHLHHAQKSGPRADTPAAGKGMRGPHTPPAAWLRRRASCAWRLALLQAWPRWRWAAGRREALEIRWTRDTGLVDVACVRSQGLELGAHAGASVESALDAASRAYVRQGDACSMAPNLLFSPRHYTAQLPGRVLPRVNRLLHYALAGRFLGLSPSPWFSGTDYLAMNRDVQRDGVGPLQHYLHHGWREGRLPQRSADPHQASGRPLRQRLAQLQADRHGDPVLSAVWRSLPPGAPVSADGLPPWMLRGEEREARRWLDPARWASLPPSAAQARVDVVVPVHSGIAESLACLHAVLNTPQRTAFELVVVDDCGPDPALRQMLRWLADQGRITLLSHARNLGFVAAANAGMALHAGRDAVLLNADTVVSGDWLDRLLAHLQRHPEAASVTPLSNNATICSYPRPQVDNGALSVDDAAALDALAAECNPGVSARAPTGVGFCMAVRRSAWQQVGPLDLQAFGHGYGEENDWCQRAQAQGWVHLLAADVLVLHRGGVSFGSESSARIEAALRVLARRHPAYDAQVQAFIREDPLAPARARLDAARLARRLGRPTVLQVGHARGGGAWRSEKAQSAEFEQRGWGVLQLRPVAAADDDGQARVALLAGDAAPELPTLARLRLDDEDTLCDVLRRLAVREVQVHHLVDLPEALPQVLARVCARLGLAYEVVLHDYHLACPRINLVGPDGRYCGEPEPATCNVCLAADPQPSPGVEIMAWRQRSIDFLRGARSVCAPHADAAQRLQRLLPGVGVQVVPHEPGLPCPPARPLRPRGRRLLVVGALSDIKGFEVVRALAASREALACGLSIQLLGYSRDDEALRQAGVEVLGRYDDAQLSERLLALNPDRVLIPSIWPETHCFALSEPLRLGLPVAVFDLGAQAARVRAAGPGHLVLPLALAGQPDALARALAGPATLNPPEPFFILGCVRSGTTLLRDLLRVHPHLACPEETHFYRWAEPFGSPAYRQQLDVPVLVRHRAIDGVPEAAFWRLLEQAGSRKQLMQWYAERYLSELGAPVRRWFDKTPQNIYGAQLLASDFPQARFVHLVRHPLDVVSSLREGKVLKISNLVAACAYWNEAVALADALTTTAPDRVLTVRYEDLLGDPAPALRRLLNFLGETDDGDWLDRLPLSTLAPVRHHDLSPDEVEQVMRLCETGRRRHGYIDAG